VSSEYYHSQESNHKIKQFNSKRKNTKSSIKKSNSGCLSRNISSTPAKSYVDNSYKPEMTFFSYTDQTNQSIKLTQ